MVARHFFRYLWLVFRRSLSGVFILVDLLGVLLILLSVSQPNVPIFVSIGVFALIWVFSSYLVWNDMVNDKAKLDAKVSSMKSQIPRYSVSHGAIEKFSIDTILGNAADELDAVKKQKAAEAKAKDFSTAATFGELAKFSVNLPRMFRGETLDEKEDRLLSYVEELVAFEDSLARIYKVPLFFEVTRADENIEFTVEVAPESKLIVNDDYERNNIPKTYTPSPYDIGIGPIRSLPSAGLANRLYPYSYAKKGVGYSKLTKVNASQKYNLFDEDFYISTDADQVELIVTVHSGKINSPQIINLNQDLKNISAEQVVLREDEDE